MAPEQQPASSPSRGGSAESPWQVREVSTRLGDYLARLGTVWIEGEVAEFNLRAGMSYLVLRDTTAEVSVQVVVPRAVLDSLPTPPSEGTQVVVHARVEWWDRRGEVRFRASAMRAVGLGELLAVLEARRTMLAAEGLFDDSRKRPLPFLPRLVGLICGRGSAAERDVIDNARRRWPNVDFLVREVPVQGPESASAVRKALIELDRDASVDVIVITRGGGSFEDLLPFSDEQLLRAVANAATPVVSAIGHEEDSPLLDLVADVRASTPTDAARRIVPDVRDERARVKDQRDRIRARVVSRLTEGTRDLAAMRSHPALRDPRALLNERSRLIEQARRTLRQKVASRLTHEQALALGRRRHLMALSPQATLDRGFAVVRLQHSGRVVTSSERLSPSDVVDVRVATGSFHAQVTTIESIPLPTLTEPEVTDD